MRHASYWETDLPPAPPSGELASEVDVLIVGAGFMGRWLAYFLRGHSVQVIERDGFSYGASSRNAGFLTSGQISEMLADAAVSGREAVWENCMFRRRGISLTRHELPELEVDECGSFDYDPVTEAGLDMVSFLNRGLSGSMYLVRRANFGGRVQRAYFNAGDGGVNPAQLLQLLQAKSPHARYAFGVTALSVRDGRADLEIDGSRREVRYARAFICTNAFARDLDPSSAVVPGRGQVIVTSPVNTQTSKMLGYMNQGYDYFRFVDGRLLIGGGRNRFPAETGTSELLTTVHVREWLEQQAARVIGHRDWTVDHHWAGIMGFINGEHLGGHPRRMLDTQTEVIAGFGGMGVALTPVHASQIANE